MKFYLLPLVFAMSACSSDQAKFNTHVEETSNANNTNKEQIGHTVKTDNNDASRVEDNITDEIMISADMSAEHENMSTGSAAVPMLAVRAEKKMMAKAKPSIQHYSQPIMADSSGLPPQENFSDIQHQAIENTENYNKIDLNGVKLTRLDPVSTFSIDVDTAAYANIRRMLNQGQKPPKNAVRIEEMINYFDYGYQYEPSEHPISFSQSLITTPWNEGSELLKIALKAQTQTWDELPSQNLVFLLDVSGSMNNADKLPLLKQAFKLLVKQLRDQDKVSIVVYAGASGIVLDGSNNESDILNALEKLQSGGSTNGGAGIELAYKTAQKHFVKGGINRVILATDGDFNVGTTSQDTLKEMIKEKRESGVFLSILGFGTGNYNDALMEELSNHGNGTSYYIDSFQEARRVFVDRLPSTLSTVAKDVKVQIEFNPEQVKEYRLIGYENRMLKNEDFNNDKIDAGEMGAGHNVTAIYEIVRTTSDFAFNEPLRYEDKVSTKQNINAELAFVKVRYKQPDSNTSTKFSVPITNQSVHYKDADSQSRFAFAVAGAGEILRDSPWLDSNDWDWVLSEIQKNRGADELGYRNEFYQLMKNARAL
jgi:Ca-activated chloride channel homolog